MSRKRTVYTAALKSSVEYRYHIYQDSWWDGLSCYVFEKLGIIFAKSITQRVYVFHSTIHTFTQLLAQTQL